MTHIANIPHILQYGITHKNSSNSNPNFKTIGDISLIDYRSSKQVQTKTGLHLDLGNFIPFYFGVRMPMLYVIQHGFNFAEAVSAEDIIYVVVSLQSIVDDKNLTYYYCDGHAADFFTTIYDKSEIQFIGMLLKQGIGVEMEWIQV